MASARQIAANRANASKSTGPKTAEGKAASRANALKHGLAGDGVVLPVAEAEAVAQRREAWRESYPTVTAEDEWLYEQVVVNTVRIDTCQAREADLRGHLALRAELCWDDDRGLAAEEIGARLARSPALTACRLRRTKQGSDWLLERWRGLADVLDRGGAWTEKQLALALDLSGTPAELRASWAGFGSDPGSPDARALTTREIERLERLKAEGLDDLDSQERAAAACGLEIETPRPLALLRRYEAACLRRYQWARKRLLEGQRNLAAEDDRPAPAPRLPRLPVPEALALSDAYAVDGSSDLDYERRLLEVWKSSAPPPDEIPSSPAPPSVPLQTLRPPGNRRQRRAAARRLAGRR